ncbi:MAG: helix-turn-helix domain-containing protein, partial [Bacteroidales bacterium]
MRKKLTTQEDYLKRVDRVIEYVRAHIDTEISIQRLAELSAFSTFHFHRVMRAYLGEPIGAFIVRERALRAAKLLRYTHMPVADIAYKVGYDMPSSLSKSFVKFFGISPSKYRQTKNYQIMTTQKLSAEVKLSKGKIVKQDAKQVLYISVKGDYKSVDYSGL